MDLEKKNQKEKWTEVDKNECGVLKQMATFQPNAPLKVTLILEESGTEDYEIPIENSVKTKDKNSNITNETIFGSQILPSGNFSDSTEIPPHMKTTYLNSQNFIMNNTKILQNTNQLASNMNYKTIEYNEKIRTLLDTLSKNIIRILNLAYDTYNNYKNDRLMFEKAKNNYLHFKNNIFEVSYVVTESIILPQEKNVVFIEKFISRTLEIANNIPGHHGVSRELLLNIISDLINWTKQKKRVLETSKTLTKVDHNSLPSTYKNTTMNIAPISSLQLNNINCMYCNSNHTREENMHCLNNIHGYVNGLSLKRNSSVNIPEEENTIFASKRQKLPYDNSYYQNPPQASIQNYTIDNELRGNVIVSNSNDLNIDVRLSARRSVSRDSGIGSPICTNWPSDQTGCKDKTRVTTIAKDAGLCVCTVCKATTNQICLDYCSSQRNDWNAHVSNCGR